MQKEKCDSCGRTFTTYRLTNGACRICSNDTENAYDEDRLTKAEVEEIHGIESNNKSTELPDNFDSLPAPQRARIRAQIHNAKMEKAKKYNKRKKKSKEPEDSERDKLFSMFGSLSEDEKQELLNELKNK